MRIVLLFCVLLTGCSMGSPKVWDGVSKRVSEGEFQFNIKYNRERAEAFRVNVMLRPRSEQVFPAAVAAMERASGCEVIQRSLAGDVAMITANLRC